MGCAHLNELALICLSLRSLQFRLGESMGQEEWAHLFWAIVVDARQFFGSLTDAEDLEAGALPVSNLATTRSIIQAHTVLSIRDTPAVWLPAPRAPSTPPSRALELGPSPGLNKRKTGERGGGGSQGGGSGGGASSGGGTDNNVGGWEGKAVTFAEDWNQPDVANTSRHQTVANLMAPLEQAGIDWSVGKLCRAAKVKGGVSALPVFPNRQACYRHILGKCKKRCPTGSDHLDKNELPDTTVQELCNMLAPGVAALCSHFWGAPELPRSVGQESENKHNYKCFMLASSPEIMY